MDLDLRITLTTALVLLGAFGGAALFFRQIKGNWMLPALVLLWPKKSFSGLPEIAGVIITILLTLGSITAVTRPDIIADIEKRLPAWGDTYSLQAGVREARVSATASWSQRYAEYQSLDNFVREVRKKWEDDQGGVPYPEWIVSDDYGLAAQLAFAWSRSEQKLVLPQDGILIRSLPDENYKKLSGGVLVLAVFHQPWLIWSRLDDVRTLAAVRHPVTGKDVFLGVSDGKLIP